MKIQEYEKFAKQNEIYKKATDILRRIKTEENVIKRYEQYKKDTFEIEISPSSDKRNQATYAKIYFTGKAKDEIIDIVIKRHKNSLEELNKKFEEIKVGD